MEKAIYEQNIHGAGICQTTGISIKAIDTWTAKDVKAYNEINEMLHRAFRVHNVNPCYYGEYETPQNEYSVNYTQNGNDCTLKAIRTDGMYGRGLGYKITVSKINISKGYREYYIGFAWALAGAEFNLDESGQRTV